MDAKTGLAYVAEVLAIAVLIYLFQGAPPGYLSGVTIGGKYAKYIHPLLLGILAVLLCAVVDKYLH